MSEGIAAIPRYEAYKDSGVEWLGKVPVRWNIRRAKYLFTEVNARSQSGDEELLSVSQYTGVTRKSDRVEEGDLLTNAETLEGYKKVREGDLVSNIMLAWNGSLGFSPYNGITSPAYSVYRLTAAGGERYFHYLLRTELYRAEFKRKSSGVIESRLRLYTDDFFTVELLLPSVGEQVAIAAFLDRKTAQIDQAVAIKERQIELLKERKQILIQNAVTRGLDSNVPMRNSGVEWAGEIPAHWDVRRSKFVFGQRKELAWKDDVQLSATQAYGVISQELYEEKTGYRVVKIQFHLEKRKHVEIDDFVISMRSFQGGLERAWSRGCIRSSYVVLRPLLEVDAGYFGRLFKSPRYIAALQATANFIRDGQDLNFENYSMVDLLLPPLSEQKEIAEKIDYESAKIDRAIDLQQRQIDKLKEYKSTLIDSAVTGKIRVTEPVEEAVAA